MNTESKVAEIIQEKTDWDVPNHTYMLDDKGKLIAYTKAGEDEVIWLETPMTFSKRFRKFKKLA